MVLKVLCPLRASPDWHMRADIDLRENILQRSKQRAYLARYGRQNFFEHGLSILDLNRAVRELSAVVERENELSRMKEDQ